MKAKFIGYDDKSTAYILQEFESKKVVKARNVIFKESEIQSFSMKEANPNLVSPNVDFEHDPSNDEDTKIPVQDKVGGNNTATPVAQNRPELEENHEEEETSLPRVDHTTPLTQQQKKCYKNPSRVMKQLIYRKQKTGEKLCKQNTIHYWTIILGH